MLTLTVSILVLVAIVLVALAGTLIDSAEEKLEEPQSMSRQRRDQRPIRDRPPQR